MAKDYLEFDNVLSTNVRVKFTRTSSTVILIEVGYLTLDNTQLSKLYEVLSPSDLYEFNLLYKLAYHRFEYPSNEPIANFVHYDEFGRGFYSATVTKLVSNSTIVRNIELQITPSNSILIKNNTTHTAMEIKPQSLIMEAITLGLLDTPELK